MILIEGNPILNTVAEPITNFGSPELQQLIAQMFAIMKEKNGAGLAAPQIGVSKRVFVYGFDFNPRYPDAPAVPKTAVINPEIIWLSEETVDLEEGCLSVPHKRGLVTRAKSLTYTCMDQQGKRIEKTVHDFEARIVQHEIDHLNGVLISARVKGLHDSVIP